MTGGPVMILTDKQEAVRIKNEIDSQLKKGYAYASVYSELSPDSMGTGLARKDTDIDYMVCDIIKNYTDNPIVIFPLDGQKYTIEKSNPPMGYKNCVMVYHTIARDSMIEVIDKHIRGLATSAGFKDKRYKTVIIHIPMDVLKRTEVYVKEIGTVIHSTNINNNYGETIRSGNPLHDKQLEDIMAKITYSIMDNMCDAGIRILANDPANDIKQLYTVENDNIVMYKLENTVLKDPTFRVVVKTNMKDQFNEGSIIAQYTKEEIMNTAVHLIDSTKGAIPGNTIVITPDVDVARAELAKILKNKFNAMKSVQTKIESDIETQKLENKLSKAELKINTLENERDNVKEEKIRLEGYHKRTLNDLENTQKAYESLEKENERLRKELEKESKDNEKLKEESGKVAKVGLFTKFVGFVVNLVDSIKKVLGLLPVAAA